MSDVAKDLLIVLRLTVSPTAWAWWLTRWTRRLHDPYQPFTDEPSIVICYHCRADWPCEHFNPLYDREVELNAEVDRLLKQRSDARGIS